VLQVTVCPIGPSFATRTGRVPRRGRSHLRRTLFGVPDTALVRRARKVNRVLADTYPEAGIELDFDNPFELLVVTVLSAQTTDRRVNAVRPTLFAAYPDARAMAAAPRDDLERGGHRERQQQRQR